MKSAAHSPHSNNPESKLVARRAVRTTRIFSERLLIAPCRAFTPSQRLCGKSCRFFATMFRDILYNVVQQSALFRPVWKPEPGPTPRRVAMPPEGRERGGEGYAWRG